MAQRYERFRALGSFDSLGPEERDTAVNVASGASKPRCVLILIVFLAIVVVVVVVLLLLLLLVLVLGLVLCPCSWSHFCFVRFGRFLPGLVS